MRATEFITETIQDDRVLAHIADVIMKYIRDRQEQLAVQVQQRQGADLGTVAAITQMRTDQPEYQYLMDTQIVLNTGLKSQGLYTTGGDMYSANTEDQLIALLPQWDRPVSMRSTLIHELRHALDDFKSRGHLFSHRQAYRDRPQEINARASEAMSAALAEYTRKITNYRKHIEQKWTPPPKPDVRAIIHDAMKTHHLYRVKLMQDPVYRRIFQRIYKYVMDHDGAAAVRPQGLEPTVGTD